MFIDVLTIFPELFDNFIKVSFIKKAIEKNIVNFKIYNLRDFCLDKHKKVDDEPYGGGCGMIMKVEPIFNAINHIKKFSKPFVVLLTPQGKKFEQAIAKTFSMQYEHIVFICGRYEGFDERVSSFVDEEISIGDFVLNGGEIPCMAICESVIRLLPNVLNKKESILHDSFYSSYLDYPQYTRPEEFNGLKVPSVLLSGNHKEIEKWREEQSLINTYNKRKDMLSASDLERAKEIK